MDALRAVAQPITHNLPAPLRAFGESLIGRACYRTLVLDVDLASDPACLKLAVSKALGIGIVAASSIVKVPQILKITSARSGAGVSFSAVALESAAILATLAYGFRQGFPFSTYGESALILAQNAAIGALVLSYAERSPLAAAFVAVLAAAAAALVTPAVVDLKTLGYLQAGAGVLGVGSKIPQILAIYEEGGTGQLSAFAVFNYLLGSLSRIFTTLQEVDDKLILYQFVAGFALNLILAAQMVYYWNAPSEKARGKQPEKPLAASTRTGPVPAERSAYEAGGAATGVQKSKGPTTRRRG